MWTPEYTDAVYMQDAKFAAIKSTCDKKQLGCILLLKSGQTISGTNGPPMPLKRCNPCPRINAPSCTQLDKCRAVHAERQCILKAARAGLSTDGAILYSYMGVPCKDCMVECIEAGISEIICTSEHYYDEMSKEILAEWIKKGGKFRIISEDEIERRLKNE